MPRSYIKCFKTPQNSLKIFKICSKLIKINKIFQNFSKSASYFYEHLSNFLKLHENFIKIAIFPKPHNCFKISQNYVKIS